MIHFFHHYSLWAWFCWSVCWLWWSRHIEMVVGRKVDALGIFTYTLHLALAGWFYIVTCWNMMYMVINPRRACAARVTVCLCVCLCVCRRLFWHCRLRGYEGIFPETTAFETYAVESHWAYSATWSARSMYLGASGSHDEWHLPTPACYS